MRQKNWKIYQKAIDSRGRTNLRDQFGFDVDKLECRAHAPSRWQQRLPKGHHGQRHPKWSRAACVGHFACWPIRDRNYVWCHRVCWWKVRSSHKRFHDLLPWTVPHRSIDDVGRIFLLSDNPPCGESKSRLVPCRTKGKVHQDAVHWIDLQSAQDKGMGCLANNFPCRFSQRLSASWLFGTWNSSITDRIIATRNSKSHPFFEVRGKHSSEARWDLLPRQRQLNLDSIYDFKGCHQKNHMEEEKKDRKHCYFSLTKADGLQKWRKASTINKFYSVKHQRRWFMRLGMSKVLSWLCKLRYSMRDFLLWLRYLHSSFRARSETKWRTTWCFDDTPLHKQKKTHRGCRCGRSNGQQSQHQAKVSFKKSENTRILVHSWQVHEARLQSQFWLDGGNSLAYGRFSSVRPLMCCDACRKSAIQEHVWKIIWNSQGSITTPPRQRADFEEVIAKLRETKGAVSAGHAFLIHMFLQNAELDSVRSNNLNNPKN